RLGGEDERPILKFTLFNSAFKAVGGSPPRYWVLPLLNFVSDFHFGHPTLDRHPLRIYPTPSVSPELRGDDALAAQFTAQMRNRLIVFGYNGGPGFIERLADYDERADKLQSGRERALVTAVMVGNLGSDTLRPSDMRVW